ncbi:MAG: IclR family transcriptional regulator [Pseudomonadota bacterium]
MRQSRHQRAIITRLIQRENDHPMTVRQIENALSVIEFFAERGTPASLAEIQSHFGWPRSSTYNILSTLVERGYMHEPARRGGYYPTRRWFETARALVGADPIDAKLAAMLAALADETGETAIIAVPGGRHAIYVNVIEPETPLRYAARVGMRVPIHAGASGRALLSRLSEAERRRTLSAIRYVQYGEGALTSPDAVEQEIIASSQRGWFQSLHEYDADLAAIALPLVIENRRMAVTVAGPVSRLGARCGDVAGILARHIANLSEADA